MANKTILLKKDGKAYKTFSHHKELAKHFQDVEKLTVLDTEEINRYDIVKMNRIQRFYYNNFKSL